MMEFCCHGKAVAGINRIPMIYLVVQPIDCSSSGANNVELMQYQPGVIYHQPNGNQTTVSILVLILFRKVYRFT